MEELDEGDKKLIADIEEFGWHVVKVMEGENSPPFAFSVGLYRTFRHPEVIIIGLKLDLAHILLNNIGDDIKNGMSYFPKKFYREILDDFECYILEVKEENYYEYLGYARWYYKGNNFPVVQCIYPTVDGIFPWETEWPEEIKYLQPILGDFTD